MRMWNVNPAALCNVHLVSEHREMHMMIGSLRKDAKRLTWHVRSGILEPYRVFDRHNELAAEMQERGFHHRTPVESVPDGHGLAEGFVCEVRSRTELSRRCEWCRARLDAQDYPFIRPAHVCGPDCEERAARDRAARPPLPHGIARERPKLHTRVSVQ